MATKAHAILFASSSDRWLHCPPSARLCETYEDKGSDYAAEGTDAHALGEYKLKTALCMPADNPTDSLKWYSEEMEDATSGYAEYVLEQVEAAKETCTDPVVLIEQRVDFSRWVEQGFGTADCIIIADGTLRVIDYKHGLGVLVSAEENPQMQCYALDALELFDDIYDIEQVSMTIMPASVLRNARRLFFLFSSAQKGSSSPVETGDGYVMTDEITNVQSGYFTQERIQGDLDYRRAQTIAKKMLDDGLISVAEFNKLTAINRETFSPSFAEIMPKIP